MTIAAVLEAPRRVVTLLDGESTAVEPIMLRGVPHRARKRFVDGTHRCAAPSETLSRIRPHFRAVGITRLSTYQTIDIQVPEDLLTYRAWDVDGREVDRLTIEKSHPPARLAAGHPPP